MNKQNRGDSPGPGPGPEPEPEPEPEPGPSFQSRRSFWSNRTLIVSRETPSSQTHITKISSKYQELVSKSTLLSGGRPNIYRLKPKKEEFSTLTRMVVGERNLNRPNKTILLVGETGTGKSTLINALFNHSIGVTWEDEVWFELVEEEGSDQSTSQTSVTVYQIFGFEDKAPPYSLTIIDTPGYGDTRGIERDVIVSDKLLDVFRAQDGVRRVHAVGLVMKSSECRLSDRLSYTLNSVTSLFGKDMERNIVALLTHSDGDTPLEALGTLEKAKVKCARNEMNQPTHFLFNNRQKKQRMKANEKTLEFAWEVSKTGLDEFFAFLEKIPPQELEETVNVLNERIRLTACIQNLQDRIHLMELKKKVIQQKQEAVRQYEDKTKENESYEVEVDQPYKDKEAIDGGWSITGYSGATCCTTCEEMCHYPGCTVAPNPKWCEVMKEGLCTVCSGKCPASDHVKDKWKYVVKTKKVTQTNTEMKEEYEKNKSAKDEELNLLQTLEDEEKMIMKEKQRLVDEAYKHVVSLEQIALNVDSVSTYVHYDLLIENMSERGDEEKVQKLKEMKRRVEEGNKSAVGYVWGKMKGFTKWWKKGHE